MNILRYLGSLALAALERLWPTQTNADPLVAVILANTIAIGPMLRTGGIIHKISADTAILVAGFVRKYSRWCGLKVSLVAALLDGESRFDPKADDPNNQDAKPGETADQAAQHADLGIEQEDISTAEGDPAFKGQTLAQIEAKLLDPDYGVHYVCSTLEDHLAWAARAFVDDVTLRDKVPNGDPNVLGVQAYNSGKNGALKMAHTAGVAGNWSYGTSIVNRARSWAYLDA